MWFSITFGLAFFEATVFETGRDFSLAFEKTEIFLGILIVIDYILNLTWLLIGLIS